MYKIYGGINVNLSEKDIKETIDIIDRVDIGTTQEGIDRIENNLEELSLKLIQILKDHRDRGLISNAEYENHIKVKKGFLNYLNEKRKISTL